MGRHKEIENNTLVCDKCGSDEIEQRAWLKVNTKKFMEWYDESDSACYCPKCGEHTTLCTSLAYQQKQEAIDNMEKEDEDETN